MRRTSCRFACALLAATLGATAWGETLHVPDDYATIQAAINAADNGDRVLVAPGTYPEVISLFGKPITVASEAGPASTVLDAQQLGPGVRCIAGETRASMLRGFTITNGRARNGGGILIVGSSPIIMDCVLEGNESFGSALDEGGGGMAITDDATPLVVNCEFRNNVAESLGGGMMAIYNCPATFVNCIAADNDARFGGGFANEYSSNVTMINCLVVNNMAPTAPGVCNFISDIVMRNCIAWGQSPNVLDLSQASTDAQYCDIGGGFFGTGNVNADPGFVDAASGDYHLTAASPCIDAASNTAFATDTYDLDGDGDTTGLLNLDLAHRVRFHDDPAVADTGVDGGSFAEVIDIGPYEYGAPAPARCSNDETGLLCDTDIAPEPAGDCVVNNSDLGALLAAYLATSDDARFNAAADFDGDQVVNNNDLGMLLADYLNDCN